MRSVQINDIKGFMKSLLFSEVFDSFMLIQGTIVTYNTISIDGRINKDFYGSDYEISPVYNLEYTPWALIRPTACDVIRGKYTPRSFKFVMATNEQITKEALFEASEASIANVKNLIMTITYDEHGLTISTGISQKTFSLDKSADEAWDKWFPGLLAKYELN